MRPTHDEIEQKLVESRMEDGSYDANVIAELNQRGVFLKFTPYGIAWSYAK